jgi:hypothetical protein
MDLTLNQQRSASDARNAGLDALEVS